MNLEVKIAGVTFKNPIILASGCCGFGQEYDKFYPMEALGGLSLKGLTPNERQGNPPPRVAETPSGMLNSVGLQNPGIDAFLERELPNLAGRDTVKIANAAGATVEEYAYMAQRLDASPIDMIEANISCPNVKQGGAAFGTDCSMAAQVVTAMRKNTTKPLMVKLSPNVTDIVSIAKSVEDAGADAISLINTLLGMRIDISTRRPVLHQNVGGLSGPAVFPIALRMVWQVAGAVKIPVVGLGGIAKWQDVIEMMIAGAKAVQIGAALFGDPFTPVKILEGIQQWMEQKGISDINDIIGSVQPY
ncbi:dihydroorotate dehydrogenase [bacterium 1XD42-1]|nr:dihydroorotate dehydrogenase [bacterium 1XD42-8]RKJ66228.1 dihydroorotate dehydrogenase [bacterium 1XD42-1]